ncbi:MAG: hypothetical protein EZS28_033461 [Streblomastix strix]|uniref:Uncharacterized protein n=1 Tax=Streblomastix strix TaxID=222440 RepID=A0A5J4ULS8_9EUKA|nr:MAG: hypothetical protein EZS28_033461 [Streblomastix strix]
MSSDESKRVSSHGSGSGIGEHDDGEYAQISQGHLLTDQSEYIEQTLQIPSETLKYKLPGLPKLKDAK